MTNNWNGIAWKRLTAEAAAIVVSILLAFWIDAWWAENLERKLEQEELARLYDELTINHDRIGHALSGDGIIESSSEASVRVYSIMSAALASDLASIEVSDLLLAKVVQTPTFEADTPAYDSLVESGRIEVVQNRRVLTALSTWERLLRNALDQQLRARRFVDDHLIPALVSSGNIGGVLLNQYEPIQIGLLSPTEITTLLVSPKLSNLMAQRYFHVGLSIRFLTQAQEAASDALIAVSAALDDARID